MESEKVVDVSKGKNSEEDLRKIIELTEVMASSAVITLIQKTIEYQMDLYKKEEKNEMISVGESLAKRVKDTLKYNYCGYIKMEFHEIPYPLHLSLSMVERDYKAIVHVMTGYGEKVIQHYDTLRQFAMAYFRSYNEIEHAPLMKDVREYCPNILFDAIKINPENMTTMFFDEKAPIRIGILPYYMDGDKVLLHKPPTFCTTKKPTE